MRAMSRWTLNGVMYKTTRYIVEGYDDYVEVECFKVVKRELGLCTVVHLFDEDGYLHDERPVFQALPEVYGVSYEGKC